MILNCFGVFLDRTTTFIDGTSINIDDDDGTNNVGLSWSILTIWPIIDLLEIICYGFGAFLVGTSINTNK